MSPIELLERHFKSFIDLDNTHNFFLGMVDYLDFLDNAPEFEAILKGIINERKVLVEKSDELGTRLIKVLEPIKIQFDQYIKTKAIQNSVIDRALHEYEGWKMKKIRGSDTIPNAMHRSLCEVIYELKNSNKHIEFIEPFCQFIDNDPSKYIQYALPLSEYNEYHEIQQEIQNGQETTLWGQLDEVSILYQMIKNGKKKMKELMDLYKKEPSSKITWEMMNLSILLSEWKHIEEGRTGNAYFYEIERVKPWLVRIHNQVITRSFTSPSAPIEDKTNPNFTYNTHTGDGNFKNKEFRLKEGTDYRKIFDAAFAEKGKKLPREKIIQILELVTEDQDANMLLRTLSSFGDSKPRKTSTADVRITSIINNEVKTIRSKTGLNNKEFVCNGGSITLNI